MHLQRSASACLWSGVIGLLLFITSACDDKKSSGDEPYRLPVPTTTSDGVVAGGEGKLYWIGGAVKMRGPTKRIHALTLADGSWSDHGDADSARLNMGATSEGLTTWIAGGLKYVSARKISCSRAVVRFDGATGQWTELPPLPEPRCAPAIAQHKGTLYVFGGSGEDLAGHGESWALTASSTTWEPLPDLPTPRAHAGAAAIGGEILVFGGEVDDPEDPDAMARRTDVVEVFEPGARTWREAESMPKRRQSRRHVTLNETLYVFPDHTVMDGDEVLKYTQQDGWSRGPEIPEAMGSVVEGAVVQGDTLLLLTRTLGGLERDAKDTVHLLELAEGTFRERPLPP